MCDGYDHYLTLAGAIEYVERESLQNELAGSVLGHRITIRSFYDLGNGIINRVGECCSTQRAALVIPPTRFPKFCARLGMEPNFH